MRTVARHPPLTDSQLDQIVRSLATGKTLGDVARLMNRPLGTLKNQLSRVYEQRQCHNLYGLALNLGYQRGLSHLPPLTSVHEPASFEGWQIGDFRISSELICGPARYRPEDIRCTLTAKSYTPPQEIATLLPSLRQAVIERALRERQILYEEGEDTAIVKSIHRLPRPEPEIAVVKSVRPLRETYQPVELILEQTGFITYFAISRALDEHGWRQTFRLDPKDIVDAELPVALGVSIHLLLRRKGEERPHTLVITRRPPRLAIYPSRYGAAVSGFVEVSRDSVVVPGGQRIDTRRALDRKVKFITTMLREGQEERGIGRFAIQTLGLVFDHTTCDINICGYGTLVDWERHEILQLLHAAKEGEPIAVEFTVESVCEYLTSPTGWVSPDAAGLVMVLQNFFGQRVVNRELGRNRN